MRSITKIASTVFDFIAGFFTIAFVILGVYLLLQGEDRWIEVKTWDEPIENSVSTSE